MVFANKWFLALVMLGSALLLSAQRDTSKAFGLAFYASYYMPDHNTASFYSARDNNRLFQVLNNPITRDRIEEVLGGYTFTLQDFASNMVYNNTFAFELEMDYRFGNNWRILAHFLNARLEAVGETTFLVDRRNTNNQTLDPFIERVTLTGKETRSHINLGLGKLFPLGQGFLASAEAGFDLNFVEVDNNRIIVDGNPFGIPTFNNQFNQQVQEITTIGSGFYLSGGLAYELTSGYGLSLKLNYYQTGINVNEVVEESASIFTVGLGFSKAW